MVNYSVVLYYVSTKLSKYQSLLITTGHVSENFDNTIFVVNAEDMQNIET